MVYCWCIVAGPPNCINEADMLELFGEQFASYVNT